MKTVLIWDQGAVEPVQFAVLDGDYTHLQGVYINTMGDEAKQDELSNLMYDPESGMTLVRLFDKFPTEAVRAGAEVIVAGFQP